MKVVNNSTLILDNLLFDSPDDFYFLQIIQRKKDGNDTGRGNNGARLIKAYYIRSQEHLISKMDKIIELCHNNNARAYISVNKRSFYKVSCGCQIKLGTMLMENNCFQAPRVWDHVCGETPALSGKHLLRLIDVDTTSEEELDIILNTISRCRGNDDGDERVKFIVPTLNGFHVITSKFDVEQFAQELAIQKLDVPTIMRDAATLMYYEQVM